MNLAVETFIRQHDSVLLMKNDIRVRDVLAYFVICRADPSLIKLTFLQKLLLGIAGDNSEGLVNMLSTLTSVTRDFLNELSKHIYLVTRLQQLV